METYSLNSEQFTAKDIKKIIGIDKNKLFYWINTHQLVFPGIQRAEGTGTRSIFSFNNLLELSLVKECLKFGLDLKTTKKIVSRLRNTVYEIAGERIKLIKNIFEIEFYKDLSILVKKTKDDVFLFLERKEEVMRMSPSSSGDPFIDVKIKRYFLGNDLEEQKIPEVYCSLRIELGKMAVNIREKAGKE